MTELVILISLYAYWYVLAWTIIFIFLSIVLKYDWINSITTLLVLVSIFTPILSHMIVENYRTQNITTMMRMTPSNKDIMLSILTNDSQGKDDD